MSPLSLGRSLCHKTIDSLTMALLACITLALAGCKTLKPSDFAANRPRFDILQFYTGQTGSTGLVETSDGEPFKRVKTETWGHMEGGELYMTQDVTLENGVPERRTWRIRRLDEHHYSAWSENVIGVAKGEAWGNAFRLEYVLVLNKSNNLTHLCMTHWMTLQPDGRTMLNVVTVRKLGIVIGRITEIFRHESEAIAAPRSQ